MRVHRYAGWVVAFVALGAAGCPDREVSRLPEGRDKVEHKEFPEDVSDKLDLLFVIDNSGSMKDERSELTENFPRFIDILSNVKGGLPSLHIGVVTSDMGRSGAPTPLLGCSERGDDGRLKKSSAASDDFIKDLRGDAPGQRIRNYTGDLKTVFTGVAQRPTDNGCGFEAHLAAMKRALDPSVNPNFLRPDALLAVVIIADEDDCSVTPSGAAGFFAQDLEAASSFACFRSSTVCDGGVPPDRVGVRQRCRPTESTAVHASVAAMVEDLKRVKGEDKVIVAGIFGEGNPVEVVQVEATVRDTKITRPGLASVCQAPSSAAPSPRLETFVTSFPRHILTSICQQDLSEPIEQIGQSFAEFLGSPCLFGTPAEPHQCAVSEVRDPGGPGRSETAIAKCDASHSVTPCWELKQDLELCRSTATKLALKVDRGAAAPPSKSSLLVECVTR